jgi:uncharacterized membrane protein
MRLLGLVLGFLFTDQWVHLMKTYAFGMAATTTGERLGAILIGIVLLLIILIFIRAVFSSSFLNGFIVATGLFLSFDIVVFHWIFQLHRITNGQEANILEPVFVVCGIAILWYGWKKERKNS